MARALGHASVMRVVFGALVAVVVFTTSAEVQASPVTFRFEMPAFFAQDLAGQTSILDVTVEQGGGSLENKAWTNTQILAMSVVAGSRSMAVNDDFENTEGSFPYIRTDAAGVPTLDLIYGGATFLVQAIPGSDPLAFIQLGTGLFTEYWVQFPDGAQSVLNSGSLLVRGTVIPLPAAAWMFLSGLVGLIGIARRKKAA